MTRVQNETTVKPSICMPNMLPLPVYPHRMPVSGKKNTDVIAEKNAAVP